MLRYESMKSAWTIFSFYEEAPGRYVQRYYLDDIFQHIVQVYTWVKSFKHLQDLELCKSTWTISPNWAASPSTSFCRLKLSERPRTKATLAKNQLRFAASLRPIGLGNLATDQNQEWARPIDRGFQGCQPDHLTQVALEQLGPKKIGTNKKWDQQKIGTKKNWDQQEIGTSGHLTWSQTRASCSFPNLLSQLAGQPGC